MKNVSLKKLNILMAFLLFFTMMALFSACSKDKGGGGQVTCPAGHVLVNNTCQYQGGYSGPGYSSIPSSQFIINGRVDNGSMFRDLINRYIMTSFTNCWPSDTCRRLQISIVQRSATVYTGYIKAVAIPPFNQYFPNIIPVVLRKVESPSNANGIIFESVYSNPMPYVPLEIWVTGDLTQSTSTYQLYFENTLTATGTMRKGIDYL